MLAPLGLRSERTGANPCLSGRQAHRIGDYPFFESDPQLIRLRAGPSSQEGFTKQPQGCDTRSGGLGGGKLALEHVAQAANGFAKTDSEIDDGLQALRVCWRKPVGVRKNKFRVS